MRLITGWRPSWRGGNAKCSSFEELQQNTLRLVPPFAEPTDVFKTYPPPPSSALLIRDLGPTDRPRERLLRQGVAALSDAELLALLLVSGTRGSSVLQVARRLLSAVNHDLHALARLELADLTRHAGVGPAKAARLLAALELSRRRRAFGPRQWPVLDTSADAYRYLRPRLADLNHEEFYVLCLNRANELLGGERISSGGVTATVADAKRIFRSALRFGGAVSLVLAHNHPSGQAFPSAADLALTRKICAGARQLDLFVLDHLIVAGENYYSFGDEGTLYPEDDDFNPAAVEVEQVVEHGVSSPPATGGRRHYRPGPP